MHTPITFFRIFKAIKRASLPVLSISVLLVSTNIPSAQAISPAQLKIFHDGIEFLDAVGREFNGCNYPNPNAAGGGAGGAPTTADMEERAREIFAYLTQQKGMSGAAAAAFIGNWIQESGLDPRINQNGGGVGRGLVQWSQGGRWDDDPPINGQAGNLRAFANGRDVYDLYVQLDFVAHEITTNPGYRQTLDAVRNGTDPAQIALVISDNYERPSPIHANNGYRMEQATAYFRLLGNTPGRDIFAAGATGGAPVIGGATTTGGGAVLNCAATGNFTGVPGQTQPHGQGFTLMLNTDYSATPCAPGSTEDRIYLHPTEGFQIRVCIVDGTGIDIASIVSDRVVAMVAAARAAGVELNGGGFRTYEEQIDARIRNHCPDIYNSPSSACSPNTAKPGNSQHERGLAIDFSLRGTSIAEGSAPFSWLYAHAREYGYYNYEEESWHWSPSGT